MPRFPSDLRPPWAPVLLAMFAIAVQMAFRLAVPLSFEYLIDEVIARSNRDLLLRVLAALGTAWAVQAALSLVQDRAAALAGTRVVERLRLRMFDVLSRLSAERARHLDAGDVMARFTDDLARIERACVSTAYIFGFSSLNVLLSVVFLFVLEWRLALLNLAGLALGFALPRALGGSARRQQLRRRRAEAEALGTVQESIGTLDVVRAFNLRPARLALFREKLDVLRDRALNAYLSSSLVARSSGQSSYLIQVLTMGFATWLVLEDSLSLGTLVAFVALLQNLVSGVSHLSGSLPEMIEASTAIERVRGFLGMEGEVEDEEGLPPAPPMVESLELQDVGYEYVPGHPALSDVTLRLAPGSRTALVGPSGAGKSTLLKLILRFHDPSTGQILLDGRDLRELSRESVRGQIGVVPQEPVLFHASLRDNIRMGRLDADDEAIVAAATAAGIHETIRAMPDGYETLAEQHGRNLSGGQRQRITLARALVRQPRLLVLDEATSSLDPGTEREILAVTKELARTRAILLVTHRLQTVTDFDRILLISESRLVESGTHDELLERDGAYARLWHKQDGFEIDADGRSARITPQRLRKIPVFSELSDDRLESVAAEFESHFLPADRTLFRRGDPGDRFFVIADGLVEVRPTEEDRTQFRRMLLDTGDFLGELALLDGAPRSATVRTRLPTLFLSLGRASFLELLDEEEDLRRRIAKTADARRRRMRENTAKP